MLTGAMRVCGCDRGQSARLAVRPDYLTCAHNLQVLDEPAHAICGCASSRKHGQATTLVECALHGHVTPLARQTKEGHRSCLGCQDFRGENPPLA